MSPPTIRRHPPLFARAVHRVGVALLSFVGDASVPALGYSLALAYVTLGTWLSWKGFDERPSA